MLNRIPKKINLTLYIMIVFLVLFISNYNNKTFIIETKYKEYKSSWWIYDQIDYESNIIDDSSHTYITEYTIPVVHDVVVDYNTSFPKLKRHIEIANNGQSFKFTGYPDNPIIFDFVFQPSNVMEKKTFQFSITKDETPGFTNGKFVILFNTNVSGNYSDGTQKLSGYALSVLENGIFVHEFNDYNPYEDKLSYQRCPIGSTCPIYQSFFAFLASQPIGSNETKLCVDKCSLKVETTPVSIKVSYKNSNDLNFTDDDVITWNNGKKIIVLEKKQSTGFGLGRLHFNPKSQGDALERFPVITVNNYNFATDTYNEDEIINQNNNDNSENSNDNNENDNNNDDNDNTLESETELKKKIQNCKDKEYSKKNPELCKNVECVGFNETTLGKKLQEIFTIV